MVLQHCSRKAKLVVEELRLEKRATREEESCYSRDILN